MSGKWWRGGGAEAAQRQRRVAGAKLLVRGRWRQPERAVGTL